MVSDNVGIITKLIGLFNATDDRANEYMREVFSDQITGKFWSTSKGSFRKIEKKEPVIKAFMASHNPANNVLWSPMNIFEFSNKVIWEGFWVGSDWKTATGANIGENFKLAIICVFEFDMEGDEGKICNFEYFTDTFEMMKLSGRALVQEGDHEKIQNFISNLVDLGMLPEIILSLYF